MDGGFDAPLARWTKPIREAATQTAAAFAWIFGSNHS
jgi:hypothetical protein